MKTSTKFILLTILVIVGCVTTYNFKLKAMYDAKSYRNRFFGMEFTSFSGVEKLNLKTDCDASIKIEQGDKEGIWIDEKIKDKATISVKGDALNLDLKSVKGQEIDGSIIVITKKLNSLVVKQNPMNTRGFYFWTVAKYRVDKLNLQVLGSSNVYFEDVRVDTLNAIVGDNTGMAKLALTYNTQVNIANFNIGNSGSLNLKGMNIKTINNIPDSSKSATGTKNLQLAK